MLHLCYCLVCGSGSLQGDPWLSAWLPSLTGRHLSPLLEPRLLIISPLQVLTFAEAAQTPGYAGFQVGVQRKLTNNLSACCSSGTDFILLVVKTLGGLAEDTTSTSAELLRIYAVTKTLCSHHQEFAWPLGSQLVAAMPFSGSTGSPLFPLSGRHIFFFFFFLVHLVYSKFSLCDYC